MNEVLAINYCNYAWLALIVAESSVIRLCETSYEELGGMVFTECSVTDWLFISKLIIPTVFLSPPYPSSPVPYLPCTF